jgi:hypothetical protein
MPLDTYQTADTAWRWQSRKDRLEDEIENLEIELDKRRDALIWLERRPPLYHLFNWSA